MSTLQTYVEFYYPGVFFDESSVQEVASRDTNLSIPTGAFGFRFFDIMSTETDGVKMASERHNHSPMYYVGGRIMTISDVRREMPELKTLLANMEGNHWEQVVLCRTGNFKPFLEHDVLIQG